MMPQLTDSWSRVGRGQCPFHRAKTAPEPVQDSVELSRCPVSGRPDKVTAEQLKDVVERHPGNPSQALQELHQAFGPSFQVQTQDGLLHFDHHPDTMRKALMTTANRAPEFEKSDLQTHGLARLLGQENLFLVDGAQWETTRSALAPFFHPSNLRTDEKARSVTRILDRHLDRLQEQLGPGGRAEVNLLPLLRKATLEVALREILGAELEPGELEKLHQAFEVANRQVGQSWILPPSLTSEDDSGRVEYEKARSTLREWAGQLIDRREGPSPRGDALDLLLKARDPDTGKPFDGERLRNEVMNLMLAGHETTANLLSWTLTDLARDPGRQSRLAGQIQAEVGQQVPTVDQLDKIDSLSEVWREQAREHPPNFIISRQAIRDTEIGPTEARRPLEAGTTLIISTELANHDAGRGMFSFGGGRRFCLGARLAMLETELFLTRFMQRFQVEDSGPRGVASGFAQSPSDTTVTVLKKLQG